MIGRRQLFARAGNDRRGNGGIPAVSPRFPAHAGLRRDPQKSASAMGSRLVPIVRRALGDYSWLFQPHLA